jgi:hypothetical protein
MRPDFYYVLRCPRHRVVVFKIQDRHGPHPLTLTRPTGPTPSSRHLQPRQGNTDMESIGRCTLSPFNTILPHYELNYPNAPPPRPPLCPPKNGDAGVASSPRRFPPAMREARSVVCGPRRPVTSHSAGIGLNHAGLLLA